MRDAVLNDILIIPDLFGWITGHWAEQLARAVTPYRTLICPSWFLREHPALSRHLLWHSRMTVNLDPWFARELMERIRELPSRRPVVSVIHHVNTDDPNTVFVAKADLPVAACEDAQHHLAQLLKGAKEVLLVENGVDLEEFRPLEKEACRRSLGFDDQNLVVGFVGKASSDFQGRKGLDTLGKIVSALRGEAGVEFAMCGRGWGDWCWASAKEGGRVRHVGFVERGRLSAFYNALDVLLITARNEAGPASLLEAMACGIPVVASRTGVVPKLVVDGENGFCLAPDDVAGFVRAVKMLAANRKLCRSLGERARIRVEAGWAWQAKLAPLVGAIDSSLKSDPFPMPSGDWLGPLRRGLESFLREAEARRCTT